MRYFRNLAAAVVCAGLGSLSLAAKSEDKPKPPATKADSTKKKEKGEDSGKAEKGKSAKSGGKEGEKSVKMSLPIPKGHDSKGLKIPYFDEANEKLQMTFVIGLANRVDDDHVRMQQLQIETFDDSGNREMMIDVPNSMLDLNTRILTTKESVTIKRSDFEITGRTMEFNTQTKQGKLGGNVRMIIYNLDEETTPDSSGEPKTANKTP